MLYSRLQPTRSKAATLSRVTLIHWNATEARVHAERLQRAGYEVERFHPDQGSAGLRALADNPADAYLIDLSRMPSHGRDMGIWLRQRKSTRPAPLVFVDGEPVKVERLRKLLPDAVYTDWSRIPAALQQALANPPAEPVVPPSGLAGYSGTPLPRKLGIKAGSVVAVLGAPQGFDGKLSPLPGDVTLRKQAQGPAGVILLFAGSKAEMKRRFAAADRALAPGGRLWIVWPKKASGVATDLTQTAVRAFGLGNGYVDFKICAVDETWSGLAFARRRSRQG